MSELTYFPSIATGATAWSTRHADTLPYTVTVDEDMAAVAAEWRAFEKTAAMTVFQSYAWLSTWASTAGARRGSRPRIVTVRDREARTVMILPLALERRMGVEALVWMGEQEADYLAPLVDPSADVTPGGRRMTSICIEIARAVPEACALIFERTVSQIGETANPLCRLPSAEHPCRAHALTLGNDWDTLYAARRGRNTRKRDRQRRRRLEELGALRFEIAVDASSRHRMLDTILAQKAHWFAARGIADPFISGGASEFLHALIDDPVASQDLHISALTLDGEVVAGNFGYLSNAELHAVIGSVTDGEAARHSPGNVLLHELFRWCISHGLTKFDFTIGDEPYKKEWCDTELELRDIRLPVTLMGFVALAPRAIRAAAVRAIKRSPRVYALAYAARRYMRTTFA